MKKIHRVKMVPLDGESYIFEFETDDIEKALSDYLRTVKVKSYKILKEVKSSTKQMLFG